MAPESASKLSFDEIIQRDREERDRKNNQDLANDIFGRSKKEKLNLNGSRKPPSGPSLASRVGVSKPLHRSTSNSPRLPKALNSPRGEQASHRADSTPLGPRNARQNPMAEKARNDLLSEALIAKGATTQPRSRASGPEISIRGAAGPYVVVAQNFAPGTTAADIETAMVPNAQDVISCRLLASMPTVMAELLFHEKRSAESVIQTFNNQKADGRVLHVYMKVGGPSPNTTSAASIKSAASQSKPADRMTVDGSSLNVNQDASSDRRRRADPQLQDGRYGFADKENDMDVDQDEAVKPTEQAVSSSQEYSGGTRRESYQEERSRRVDNRYNPPSRHYDRNAYYNRDWGNNRPMGDRRPYGNARYGYSGRGY